MSLPVGFNILSDRDTDAPPMSAVLTCSKEDDWDHGGWQLGHDESFHLGAVWIDRPYFTGNPTPEWLAQKVKRNHKAGGLTQLGNEQNHPIEAFHGAPADLFALHDAVLARLTPDEQEGVIASPPSPGFPEWQRWVNKTARKHAVHCYGDRQLMQAVVQWFLDNTTADLYLTEIDPGAGNRFDLDAWARDHLRPFLAWCEAQPRVQVVLYFAWKWNESRDLPSSVDAAGTAVATTLRDWVARGNGERVRTAAGPVPGPAGQVGEGAGGGVEGPDGDGRRGAEGAAVGDQHPDSPEQTMTRAELVALVRDTAARNGYDPDVAERQAEVESNFDPAAGSDAGAQGLWQIVPKYHPNVDPYDPVAATEYATKWMAALVEQYGGDLRRALIHYNGGGGAVAAYESLSTYDESARYVTAILDAPKGDQTVPQFGPELAAEGFAQDWIGSACGPIALAGALRLIDSGGFAARAPVDVVDAVLRAAPDYGWTPEGGMNGPDNFERFCWAWHLTTTRIAPSSERVREALVRGEPVVISTTHHYYLAMRRSRIANDPEVFVGNTGEARIGGAAWMTVEQISDLDGGINAAWALSANPPEVVEQPAPEPPDAVTDAFNNLADLTLTAGPHDEARRVSAQAAINILKGALGRAV